MLLCHRLPFVPPVVRGRSWEGAGVARRAEEVKQGR